MLPLNRSTLDRIALVPFALIVMFQLAVCLNSSEYQSQGPLTFLPTVFNLRTGRNFFMSKRLNQNLMLQRKCSSVTFLTASTRSRNKLRRTSVRGRREKVSDWEARKRTY